MLRYDDFGPQLYQVDPSGAFFGWQASAIGRGMQNAKTFLEKRFDLFALVGDTCFDFRVAVVARIPCIHFFAGIAPTLS